MGISNLHTLAPLGLAHGLHWCTTLIKPDYQPSEPTPGPWLQGIMQYERGAPSPLVRHMGYNPHVKVHKLGRGGLGQGLHMKCCMVASLASGDSDVGKTERSQIPVAHSTPPTCLLCPCAPHSAPRLHCSVPTLYQHPLSPSLPTFSPLTPPTT